MQRSVGDRDYPGSPQDAERPSPIRGGSLPSEPSLDSGVKIGDAQKLQAKLDAVLEFRRAVFFDQELNVLSFKGLGEEELAHSREAELRPLLSILDDFNVTLANGVWFGKEHYEVHRFHPPLVYGRKRPGTFNSSAAALPRMKNMSEVEIFP